MESEKRVSPVNQIAPSSPDASIVSSIIRDELYSQMTPQMTNRVVMRMLEGLEKTMENFNVVGSKLEARMASMEDRLEGRIGAIEKFLLPESAKQMSTVETTNVVESLVTAKVVVEEAMPRKLNVSHAATNSGKESSASVPIAKGDTHSTPPIRKVRDELLMDTKLFGDEPNKRDSASPGIHDDSDSAGYLEDPLENDFFLKSN